MDFDDFDVLICFEIQRHTGHFPDGISTWQVTCQQCPEQIQRLEDIAARRWTKTRARHTRHTVAIEHADAAETTVIDAP
ncbi:MAG: hypothetical protein ABEI57_01530 [Halapricum sp.]